jgi:DNA-binding transcriptional LysR family regulator
MAIFLSAAAYLADPAVVISRDAPDRPLIKPLTDISSGLYASPEYMSQYAAIEKPEDLPRYDYILLRGFAHTIVLPFRKEKQKLDIEVRSRFRANNSTILLSSAVAGTGIVYRGSLSVFCPNGKMDTYRAWMLFKSEKTLSFSVKRFAEDLLRRIQRESV